MFIFGGNSNFFCHSKSSKFQFWKESKTYYLHTNLPETYSWNTNKVHLNFIHVTSSDFTPFYLNGYMASLELKSLNWILMETMLMGKNALLCKIKNGGIISCFFPVLPLRSPTNKNNTNGSLHHWVFF